jgi:hypothetical protein
LKSVKQTGWKTFAIIVLVQLPAFIYIVVFARSASSCQPYIVLWIYLDSFLSWIAALNIVPDLYNTNKIIIDDGKFEVQRDHLEDCKTFDANFDKLVKDHDAEIKSMTKDD